MLAATSEGVLGSEPLDELGGSLASPDSTLTILSLPDELLAKIFKLVGAADGQGVALACKRFLGVHRQRATAAILRWTKEEAGQTAASKLDALCTVLSKAHRSTDLEKLVVHADGCTAPLDLPERVHRLATLRALVLTQAPAQMALDLLSALPTLTSLSFLKCATSPRLADSLGSLCSLRDLRVSRTNTSLLAAISRLSALTRLNLAHCFSLANHVHESESVPQAVWTLQSLRDLRFLDLGASVSLPAEVSALAALTALHMSMKDAVPPDALCELTALVELNLEKSDITSLPALVFQLAALTLLRLSHCSKLEGLPDGLGYLPSLQALHLGGACALRSLPTMISHLTSLTALDLKDCNASLPTGLSELHALADLSCRGYAVGETPSLPRGISALTALNRLELRFSCRDLLDCVARVQSLVALNVGECRGDHLPEALGNLAALTSLDLSGTHAVAMVCPRSIGGLQSLRVLALGCCERLPDAMRALTKLTRLTLRVGPLFRKRDQPPQEIYLPMSLRDLDLSHSTNMLQLPEDVLRLSVLTRLRLNECSRLNGLPEGIGRLAALVVFELSGTCGRDVPLHRVPASIGSLVALTQLRFESCAVLEGLPAEFGALSALRQLELDKCELRRLPEESADLQALTRLSLQSCRTLTSLPLGVGQLSRLLELSLLGCKSLQSVPPLGGLTALTKLDLSECRELTALPDGLGSCVSLEQLILESLGELKALPESVGELRALKLLNLRCCGKLAALPQSMGGLRCLEELNLHGCPAIECLPASMRQLEGTLTKLYFKTRAGCFKLSDAAFHDIP